MSRRRFSLTDLFLFVAFCSLLLAFVVPLFRKIAGEVNHENDVRNLAFSADGSRIAALFGDGKVRVWRASDQAPLAKIETDSRGFGGQIAISADGSLAAVFTGTGALGKRQSAIEIWNVDRLEKLATLPAYLEAHVAFSPRGRTLAVAKPDDSVDLYLCRPDGPPEKVQTLVEKSNIAKARVARCPAIAFADDGKTLAVASWGVVLFWDVDRGEILRSFKADYTGTSDALAISPNGRWAAACGSEAIPPQVACKLEVWSMREGRKLPRLHKTDDLINDFSNSLAFLPDGRTLVYTGGLDSDGIPTGGDLRAWDVESRTTRLFPHVVPSFSAMLAAPFRGNRFAVAEVEKIILWDATTLAPREVLWTPPASGPSTTLLVAAVVLFMVWAVRRGKKLARQCATCGQSYYLVNAKDSQTECPNCRLAALPAEAREKQQVKDRRKRRGSYVLLCVSLLAISFLGGVRMMLVIMPAVLLAIAALIGGLFAWSRLRGRRLSRESGIVQLVEPLAGAPAEVLRYGPVMVWCGEGTTLGREIERELAVCTDRVRSLTGQAVRVARKITSSFAYLHCSSSFRRESEGAV